MIIPRLLRKLICFGILRHDRIFRRTGDGIYLTFDDGPDPAGTPMVVELLRKYGIKATFFINADKAQRHPDLVRMLVSEGHLLGNHTYSHELLPSLSPRAREEQVSLCQNVIEAAQPAAPKLFRPPQGLLGLRDLAYLVKRKFTIVLWTCDSCDSWLDQGVPEQVSRLKSCCTSSEILLFHDDSFRCTQILQELLPHWLSRNLVFKFVTY